MIALTSIAPKHFHSEIQSIAVNSWIELGMKVYSFNCKKEIELLKETYKQVTFIECEDNSALLGRPHVKLSDLILWAKDSEYDKFCFINSDIILKDADNSLQRIKESTDAFICKRRDFTNDINDSKEYELGIDVFILTKEHLEVIKYDGFYIGLCHWDYTVPYSILKSNMKVNLIKNRFAFHRLHPTQYSSDSWVKTGANFAKVHGLNYTNVYKVSMKSYDYIMENVKLWT